MYAMRLANLEKIFWLKCMAKFKRYPQATTNLTLSKTSTTPIAVVRNLYFL